MRNSQKNTIRSICAALCIVLLLSGCATDVSDTQPGESTYPTFEFLDYEPGIIDTVYDTEEIVVVDYVVDTSCGADPTGKADSTKAIQAVLNTCADNGGGTVYLPRGQYRITSTLFIPSFVYLRGDYNDPDAKDFNGEYGTILLADVAPAEQEIRNEILADREDIYSNFPALIRIGGSSGLIGMTIYYPEQDIDHVTPYPFAIEIPSFAGDGGHINHHTPIVEDVTMLNCYKGIIAGASASVYSGNYGAAFEQVHIENVKGTFLYQGFQLYIASEAGTVRDVSISNDYWKNCTLGAADQEKLDAYTMQYTTGMLLGDLEWLFFDDISIQDVCMGIRIYDGIRRFFTNTIYFIGQFYHLDVRNTKTAVRIDNMMPNFGITIADSYLEGSVYSINERDTTTSSVKIVNTKLIGDTYGDSLMVSGANEYYAPLKEQGMLADTKRPALPKPAETLIDVVGQYGADNTGASDTSAAIQQALDYARDNGGGIVYLKAGYYWLDAPLTVYDNTELRGAASGATRDQIGMSKGTVLLGNYGYAQDKIIAENSTALVTLQGSCSGIRGIRVIYPDNKPQPNAAERYRYHSYVVRILGSDSYVAQCSLVGVPYGIEIVNANDAVVTELSATFYDIGIRVVNSDNVYIDEVLENAAVVSRLGFANVPALQTYFLYGWPTDGSGLTAMYSQITRPFLTLFKAENAVNLSIVNCSAFGIRTFYDGMNSNAKILACNSDNCSDYIWKVDGGTLHSVNMFKYNDKPTYSSTNGGKVTCFNTLTLYFTPNFVLDSDDVDNVAYVSNPLLASGKDVNDLPDRYKK